MKNHPIAKVWIVDDDDSLRFVIDKAMQLEGFAVRSFGDAASVLAALQQDAPDVLMSDIRMPGGDGLDLLAQIKDSYADLPVIIMTAYSDLDSAVSSFAKGAYEYLAKPFDLTEAVQLVRRAVRQKPTVVPAARPSRSELLGSALAMQEVFRAIGRLSQSQATVLITGESGTGKELVARAIHKHSIRANGPFVAINTAAIPKDLLESELFGHERGAFTGAQGLRRGRFEQAEGGTLFLDEIGDMPLDLQTRLLRVLSEGSYFRVGGVDPIRSNVRIVAATHQDLESLVKTLRFRDDLYHRLNVIRLSLPPLRERAEDIPALALHFLQQAAKQNGSTADVKKLSSEAMAVLQAYDYPGNVRQLENICHWLSVMAPSPYIEKQDLPKELLAPKPQAGALEQETGHKSWTQLLAEETQSLLAQGRGAVWEQIISQAEQSLIQSALKFTKGRRTEAAEKLGIGRNTMTRKISELQLDNESKS